MAIDLAERPASRGGAHARRQDRSKLQKFVPLILVLAGLVAMLYPVLATLLNNSQQSGEARAYTEQIQSATTAAEREAAIASARKWNEENQGRPVLDPWLARITEDNDDYRAYLAELSLSDAMGRVIIPSIKSDLPVYHGTTEKVLQNGIGHLFGSSLPVGGAGTHAVLTGHTGLAASMLWDNLTDVREGDAFYLQVAGEKMKYVVDDIRVVEPQDTGTLVPEEGLDQVTLITCTPYGINTHRLLVTGQRAPLDPDDEQVFAAHHSPWQWWQTAVLAVVAVVLAVIIYRALRARRATSVAPVAGAGRAAEPGKEK